VSFLLKGDASDNIYDMWDLVFLAQSLFAPMSSRIIYVTQPNLRVLVAPLTPICVALHLGSPPFLPHLIFQHRSRSTVVVRENFCGTVGTIMFSCFTNKTLNIC
jgi:hypothetical protein